LFKPALSLWLGFPDLKEHQAEINIADKSFESKAETTYWRSRAMRIAHVTFGIT
jgi:hypothetical protein